MEYTKIPDYSHNNANGGAATILCSNCGVPMDGSKGLVMCYDCIKLTTDITKNIPKEANISFCRNCERFLQPPNQWMRAELESRELLAICLRRLKGLNKEVRLVDAAFIWTEPHSRRIRIKLTVQGEAMTNTIVQQSFEVEFVVIAMQCPDCAKSYTTNTWRAAVQVRQKVSHKRTFLYLEQLILKHNAHVDTISIKESKDGLDFYYSQRNHAVKMLDFLSAAVPIKSRRSEELVSVDIHSGSSSYKFSYSVEIVPICRDDLVVLPKKVARSLGNISRLVLCSKVTNMVQFLDFKTLQTVDLLADKYWRTPFTPLADVSELTEFIVLNVEPVGTVKGKYVLADVTCAREADLGQNDREFYVRSHLGGILHPGDSVLGYYLTNSNFNNQLWDELVEAESQDLSEVVLVKKKYERKSKRSKNRAWKLKRMAREHNDITAEDGNSRAAKQEYARAERDYEIFLQELEEDKELRETVNLYKDQEAALRAQQRDENNMETDDEDEDAPVIDVDELLDELDDMTLDS